LFIACVLGVLSNPLMNYVVPWVFWVECHKIIPSLHCWCPFFWDVIHVRISIELFGFPNVVVPTFSLLLVDWVDRIISMCYIYGKIPWKSLCGLYWNIIVVGLQILDHKLIWMVFDQLIFYMFFCKPIILLELFHPSRICLAHIF